MPRYGYRALNRKLVIDDERTRQVRWIFARFLEIGSGTELAREIVGAASRSHYRRLLEAGCVIHEFEAGLLHAKTLTMDDLVTIIGSTNLDLRSFDLNYENDMMLQDETTKAVRARQQDYIDGSRPVFLRTVLAWPWHRRIWNNVVATVGPVL